MYLFIGWKVTIIKFGELSLELNVQEVQQVKRLISKLMPN